MCAVSTLLGLASALLLVVQPGACDEYVTTERCKLNPLFYRVRRYPTDDATGLIIGHCGLTELDPIDIANLTRLEMLYIDDNAIDYIDPDIFHSLPTLKTLRISVNKLRELPIFPVNSCPRLFNLDLSENQLTGINDPRTFAACTRLSTLDLTSNKISYIHPDVFHSLTSLTCLELGNNKLTFIPENMFTRNPLETLHLYENSLTHLPHDFVGSINRRNNGFHFFYFYDNPWHCACLLELLADMRRANFYYTNAVYEYDGKVPKCVYSGPYPCNRSRPTGLLRL
ncbi:leucine-rich repeat-containing protein 15-like [Cydia amplana]|uniref:leucine-rich repeat-containing protein 15-like n=1 Tax=Cydia amplana TaxID=1869771 RepID=UPI002FE64073